MKIKRAITVNSKFKTASARGFSFAGAFTAACLVAAICAGCGSEEKSASQMTSYSGNETASETAYTVLPCRRTKWRTCKSGARTES